MHAVILAGGSGTRFWPKSREQLPKQLLNINGERTMIQDTLDRISPIVASENIWIITNEKHALETCRQLKATEFNPSQLLTEPIARNTAAAIGYSAYILSKKNPDAIMAVFPADHAITTHKKFLELIEKAKTVAKNNHLVTLGIKPTSPETGYGYIKQGKSLEGNAYKVDQFIEKPDKATAEKYLTEGGYYWNSGMFIWKVSVLLNEIKRYLPNLYAQLDKLSKNTIEVKGPYPFKELNDSGKKIFQSLQPVSIDHGIMESSNNSVVFPANIGWNDVGSWTALADISQKDSKGNVIKGNVFSIENNNSIFYAEERLVATMGLKNMIVVDTSDAVLVCPKDCAQDVKKIVEKIKQEKRPEVSIAPNSEIRPWGNYVILKKEANYLVKRIEVLPGESLSLQSHNHRSEHWTIVAGTALVQINESSKTLQANQFIEIPKGAKHRLANHGNSSLIIIEVQLGEKLDENDITRYADKYGRTSEDKDN
jgi:mannose-1-phosphate guanylyltransferase / mannose-6-phosphate isomerase